MNQDRARITVADGAVAAILFAVAAAVGAYHGFDRPLHHEHDANITYLYQTLLINDGLKQTYMDHTGYLFLTLLSAWLKIVHLFGGVPAIGISALEGSADMRAQFFDLLVAARVLPVILTGAMGGVFYALLRVLDIR